MENLRKFVRLLLCATLSFTVGSCAALPIDCLRMPPDNLAKRQLQTRKYETTNEEQILSACSGVLQDLGFTIEDSETKLGLITSSKDRSAIETGQVVMATAIVLLAALGGTTSNAYNEIDATQKIRACVISNRSLDGDAMTVRVTFQRMVWNRQGSLSKLETMKEPELYQGFFERLSKSIFLEAQAI